MAKEQQELTDWIVAHVHSGKHRESILSSQQCGCFFCLSVYPPAEIVERTDEMDGVGQTAICPKCGIDSVIGSQSGYPVNKSFLKSMQKHFFNGMDFE